jgi:hypothetical protein
MNSVVLVTDLAEPGVPPQNMHRCRCSKELQCPHVSASQVMLLLLVYVMHPTDVHAYAPGNKACWHKHSQPALA